MVSKLLFVTL